MGPKDAIKSDAPLSFPSDGKRHINLGCRAGRLSPPPWTVEQSPGGYKVKDANGQSLAYCYARDTKAAARISPMGRGAAHREQYREVAGLLGG
jgi:hypothetical protein